MVMIKFFLNLLYLKAFSCDSEVIMWIQPPTFTLREQNQNENKIISLFFYIRVKWYEKDSSIDNSHGTLVYANDSTQIKMFSRYYKMT